VYGIVRTRRSICSIGLRFSRLGWCKINIGAVITLWMRVPRLDDVPPGLVHKFKDVDESARVP
jgi:hypothetical protein